MSTSQESPQRLGLLERFLRLETGSAILLMAAAVIALIWVNVSEGAYEGLWTTEIAIDLGPIAFEEDLRHLVNDLLMAVFFYVVALEVKREALLGSLRDPRSAAVPIAAAFGTIIGAALTYVAVNLGEGGQLNGWAIPIATDIAFAVGALGLLGRRAPRELRTFLLTLAITDDIATIAVIALFYSSGIAPVWLAAAAGATLAVLALQRLGVRSLLPYVGLAGLMWFSMLEAGVHPTIAGVLLGFLTPAAASARESVSPMDRMEANLHPWSAYAVLPVFALANAGVPLSLAGIGGAITSPVGLGIILGLVVGAPVSGILASWASVRFGPARLPDGLDWGAISAVAPLKGIGFTVAIFISILAFDDVALQNQAKLAILVASAMAAAIGWSALYARHRAVGVREEVRA